MINDNTKTEESSENEWTKTNGILRKNTIDKYWEIYKKAKLQEWKSNPKLERIVMQYGDQLTDIYYIPWLEEINYFFAEWKKYLDKKEKTINKLLESQKRTPDEELLWQTTYSTTITKINQIMDTYSASQLKTYLSNHLILFTPPALACWVEYGLNCVEVKLQESPNPQKPIYLECKALLLTARDNSINSKEQAEVMLLHTEWVECKKAYDDLYNGMFGTPYRELMIRSYIKKAKDAQDIWDTLAVHP